MTKQEFIERYGLEAYQRKLERSKQYYKQHREECNEQHKQYYEKHKEELKEYKKQYRLKHKEQYRESSKKWSRKNVNMFAYCITEQLEQIENYELAKKDNFKGWCIHHRLETHNSDGERRIVNLSVEELLSLDMYYNRPANELIFFTNSEHAKLHSTDDDSNSSNSNEVKE